MRGSCKALLSLVGRTAAVTSQPFAKASATKLVPMKPLAPVIKILFIVNLHS